MKFATVEQVKKLRESGMRKKDREFWGSDNLNVWLCWMGSVIKFQNICANASRTR